MRQKSWPSRSEVPKLPPLPFIKKHHGCPNSAKPSKTRSIPAEKTQSTPLPPPPSSLDLSALPYDVLVKIAGAFNKPNLMTASVVCRAWRDALKPLRGAMSLLMLGKRFKHGRGVEASLSKALDAFLKGAARGSTLAMVDAGMMYWEMGDKQEAAKWYRKAAELGDPAGQCNLAISMLQADPQISKEAIELLYKASIAGHVRAQYQLALSFHHGRGAKKCPQQAARWYQKAAQGGYVRAMYNTSLCYLLGEGFWQSHNLARKWMKRAADSGHINAQLEHGLTLFSQGDLPNAVVYLELATRAGQTAAAHVRNTILQQLSETSRAKALLRADRWRPLPCSFDE